MNSLFPSSLFRSPRTRNFLTVPTIIAVTALTGMHGVSLALAQDKASTLAKESAAAPPAASEKTTTNKKKSGPTKSKIVVSTKASIQTSFQEVIAAMKKKDVDGLLKLIAFPEGEAGKKVRKNLRKEFGQDLHDPEFMELLKTIKCVAADTKGRYGVGVVSMKEDGELVRIAACFYLDGKTWKMLPESTEPGDQNNDRTEAEIKIWHALMKKASKEHNAAVEIDFDRDAPETEKKKEAIKE